MAFETQKRQTDHVCSKLHKHSITKLAACLRSGSITSVALTDYFLKRIQKANPILNAFTTVTSDLAMRQARQADQELANKIDRGPLHGIPLAVKDNIDTKGVRTTRGSCLFEEHVPEKDASIVTMLIEAGAVLLGKTAMHEFAYGMNGINPHFGPTRNPWNIYYDAGGSSSGSACAVSAGLAVLAIGTDTGGSVRQPAHSCGIVGYKPTFDVFDTSGVYPLAPSMDHIGLFTKTVVDARVAFSTLIQKCGPYQSISTSSQLKDRLQDVQLGIDKKNFYLPDSKIAESISHVLALLQKQDAEQVDIRLSGFDDALRAARTTFVEANETLLPLYNSNPTSFGQDVASKIEEARKLSKAQYDSAQRVRHHFRDQVERLFDQCDLIVLPTSNISAAPIAARPKDHPYQAWYNCGLFNFTGHPAISIPAGLLENGMPFGLMLVGPIGADHDLLVLSELIERSLPVLVLPPDHG